MAAFCSLLLTSCYGLRDYNLIKTSEGVILPPDSQVVIATHEAGHAVVMALYFGIESVRGVHVDVQCCTEGFHDHLGQTPLNAISIRGQQDYEHLVMAMLAGQATEKVFYDTPYEVDSDIRRASKYVYRSLTPDSMAFNGQYYTGKNAPEHIQDLHESEMRRLMKACELLVEANRDTVIAIRDKVVRAPLVDGRRNITQEDLRVILAKHKLNSVLSRQ